MLYNLLSKNTKDYYVVVREFRTTTPNDFGKGKKIENRYVHGFEDYLASKDFFKLQEKDDFDKRYENSQQINYIYAVPAYTLYFAIKKMRKNTHYEAKLILETPYEKLQKLKKYWDEIRKMQKENEESE